MISDCSYNVNDTVLITYKTKQPAIEIIFFLHEL
jgi:hypothetical protein